MKTEKFDMVAKTLQGLEDVLAEELLKIGAENISQGRRMVSFEGDNEVLYKANLCCRTALRILKPVYKFTASDPDTLYEMTKEFDWSTILSLDKTFSIDPVVNSDTFTHSRYVTYRVKDAIVDWFKDRYGADKRPGVRLQDADVMINVHIDGTRVTISLDSSGESLHKRGYRVAQTEAPINEVLAAGILLKAGWNGQCPLVDPMCGSGTFLIEAALIAANINPGVYRKGFAFEQWPDFDEELFERLYNDDSQERDITVPIIGCDISPKAISIAEKNVKQAGVAKYVELEVRPLAHWTEAPADGMLVCNPPYGERISVADMDGLYELFGQKLKNVFKGYHAWIIGYQDEYFKKIGLAPSTKLPLYNGALECELREYVIFEGDYKTFRSQGFSLHRHDDDDDEMPVKEKMHERRRPTDDEWRRDARKKGFGGKNGDRQHEFDKKGGGRDRRNALKDKYSAKPLGRKKKYDDDDFVPSKGDRKYDFDERRSADRQKFSDRRRDDRRSENRDRKFDGGRRDRRGGFDSPGKFFDGKFAGKGFERRRQDDESADREPSENPLAIRRNEKALRSIIGRQPSIPSMRSRKGWKRNDGNDENDADN
ncbi:MAG: THUMP domain-containing protein [Muribaculum sp.]|nr:THUMP domain-containing protein [Muribaculum sp.]